MKYVLVTGACGGMGKAVVDMLQTNGYTVFAMDLQPILAKERIIPVVADITDMNSLKQAYKIIHSVTDKLEAIIHFTGIYMLDSLVEIPEKNFCSAFDVNVFGAYRINKLFLPLLHRGSRIIITTSELAPLEPLPFTGLYAITKGALDKYAASLRMELQLLGIQVSVLRPGAVKTGMLGVSTDQLERFCNKTEIYRCNAENFRKIVDRVEAKNISAETVANKVYRILQAKHARPVYHINRNPLLLLLNALPKAVQMWIIQLILK